MHLQFTSFLAAGTLTDLICLFDPAARAYYALAALGPAVCGHRGVVHGGLSAALIDESAGAIVFCLKAAGLLERGPAFTAALNISYTATLPAGSVLAVVAQLDKVEGRKAWVSARIVSEVGSEEEAPGAASTPTLFAEGRALFVVPRAAWEAAQREDGGNGAAAAAATADETEAGVERRVRHREEGGGGGGGGV